jgi:ethanolamine utilization protein EutA (predicted chaperonin)
LTPEDVDTGAVIITGEALKKENAQADRRKLCQILRQIYLRGGGP